MAQEQLIDGLEDPLDFASPAWLANDREHQCHVQVSSYLLEVLRGEVAAVVGIERLGDAAHGPVRVTLAPDRLAQRERRLNARRSMQAQRIAGHRSAVIIKDDRQPRSR